MTTTTVINAVGKAVAITRRETHLLLYRRGVEVEYSLRAYAPMRV